MATTGFACFTARRATPMTTLPRRLWESILPSPVKMTSASLMASSKPTVSSTVSMPICSREPKKATMPAPIAPAAPAPGISATSTPTSRLMTSARCLSPWSSDSTIAGSAPFWGPKI